MRQVAKRLWGIDLLGGLYTLLALVGVWLLVTGPGFSVIGLLLLLFGGFFAVGMFWRIELIRAILLVCIVLSLILEGVVAIFVVGSMLEIFPLEIRGGWGELLRSLVRAITAISVYSYLKQPNVRAAFMGVRVNAKPFSDPGRRL